MRSWPTSDWPNWPSLLNLALDYIKINPAAFPPYLDMAVCCIHRGSFEDAERLLKQAEGKTEDPVEKAQVQIWRATSLRKQKKFPEALAAAEEAVKLDKESPDGYLEKGLALAELKQPPVALAALRQALELDPELVEEMEASTSLMDLRKTPEYQAMTTNAKKKLKEGSP